ncbi:hypothetical protein B0H11DRAFT_1909078 [Mycena galericulata]|nr:hypothetical protein B0H11DRAFT_1909078 [Mycena galericulata]
MAFDASQRVKATRQRPDVMGGTRKGSQGGRAGGGEKKGRGGGAIVGNYAHEKEAHRDGSEGEQEALCVCGRAEHEIAYRAERLPKLTWGYLLNKEMLSHEPKGEKSKTRCISNPTLTPIFPKHRAGRHLDGQITDQPVPYSVT